MDEFIKKFKVGYFYSGIGGMVLGMQEAKSEYKGIAGQFEHLFSIDNDPGACHAHEQLTGHKAECVDIFNRKQYKMFHGAEPPVEWHEFTATDLIHVAKGECPDVVVITAPCKGFSRLLPNAAAEKPKYAALNGLALRAITLSLEAWGDDPPAIFNFENVPGIETRGAWMLKEIRALLGAYGYVFHESHLDMGEIGHLGQRRIRYQMLARNPKKLPSFIYQPKKHKHRSIGDILGPLPMPGDTERGGPMHRLPHLAWRTWERLALIPAGKDWRALKDLNHTPQNGTFRIVPWDCTSPVVTAEAQAPGNASCINVSDPRPLKVGQFTNVCKVTPWDDQSATVTGASGAMQGGVNVADPRILGHEGKRPNAYQVQLWDKPSATIIGQTDIQTGALSIADPRFSHPTWRRTSVGKVADWNKPSGAIIANPNISGAGEAAVSDPRISEKWSGAGNYKVMQWDKPANAITANGDIHAGAAAVSDPRIPSLDERGVWIIVAVDGTWHRPITTYEGAMLQGCPRCINGIPFTLPGSSDAKHREWIGNMVPVQAGTAIGNALLATMMPNAVGDWHWDIDGNELWVHPDNSLREEMVI